jgi:AAA domain-containing protein
MAIPAELRTRRQWVVWRLKARAGSSKPTKVPYRPDSPNLKASSTDPQTWGTYEEAQVVVSEGKADGVGFVFTDDDPYCGIDFDGVVNGTKEIEPEAFERIKSLGTYAEYSPSGKGAHVIGRAELKDGGKKSAHGEIYDRGRFFCMTGERIKGTKAKITEIDPEPVVRAIRNGKVETKESLGPPSRHDALVSLAAQLVAAGATREFIEQSLWARAREIKLPKREHDEVGRIIDWALQQQGEAVRIAKRAVTLKVNRKAKILDQMDALGESRDRLDDDLTGEDHLAEPDEVVQYAVDDLFPVESNVLLMAERKTGKTALGLTLMKALADHEPFLGQFAVQPPDDERRVLYLNYELTQGMFKRWVRRVNLTHPERTAWRSLRGVSLPFWLPGVRDELVDYCIRMKVWCLIIDPQAMASRGLVTDENDNMQLAEFHHAIDEVKRLAGIDCSFVIHHIGKSSKTSGRGASRAEDWPDVLWYLTKKDDGRRAFRAEGRDVDVGTLVLPFDKETGLYRWEGEYDSEAQARKRTAEKPDARQIVFAAIPNHGERGKTKTAIEIALRGKKVGTESVRTILEKFVEDGLVDAEPVEKGKAKWRYSKAQ